jgi:zinc protease
VSAAKGLSPARKTLGNGLVTIVKETRKTPIVAINIGVRAGSVCDPPDAPGAVNLLARVIDRGTSSRSAAEIAEAFDGRGVSLGVSVGRHLLSFVCTCLVEDFEPIIDLIADIVRNPSIPDGELATRKGQVAIAIRQDDDSPFARAAEGLMEAMYGPAHPYGRRVKGSVEGVGRMSRDMLLELHRRRVAPSSTSVVIVGDIETAGVESAIARMFGDWAAPLAPRLDPPHAPAPGARRAIVLPMMNKSQADIAYGFTAVSRSDPRYYAYWLMNHIIGQYAIGGRLGDSIRERQGMAYYAGSTFEANLTEGPLFVRAGVSPANVDRAIASIDEELARARREGLTQKELDLSRNYLIGSMPRALETNNGIATFLQTAECFGLGLDYDLQQQEYLHQVTLDDVNAAVRETLDPARATVVIAGPYEDKSPNHQITKSPKSPDHQITRYPN